MRLLAILFLIGGVALAGGAIYYASEHFRNVEAMLANQQDSGPETVMVVAAKQPLRLGDRIDYARAKEVLRFVEWPKSAVPEGAFTSSAELLGEDKSEIRTVIRAIDPGELVLKTKISGFGTVRMSARVREGMRAYTLPINAVSGAGGLISPGDHVDIIFVRNDNNQMSSHILMQDVLVVATDQNTDTERNRAHVARTATVEVTPGDAQRLTLAQRKGTLSLLLRGVNEGAMSPSELESIDVNSLPGAVIEPEPEPVEPEVEPEETGYNVRVRRGAETQELKFE